jgi:pimeloyl-ACP methyl ester carboxylesterase/DNA-binding CsgD family transcriptional regulator
MEPLIQYTRTADGVRIAYYSMGQGVPLVATSELQWGHLGVTRGFREHHRSGSPGGLGRGMQVVRYDARGTGLSDRGAVDFSIEAQLSDLQSVLEALRLDNCILFGHVHGTPLAITYAVRHPERVRNLVLVQPYARGADLRPFSENLGIRPMPDMSAEQWEAFTLIVADAAYTFSSRRTAQNVARSFRDSMTLASYHAFLQWREHIDVTDLLSELRVPTLVLSRRTPTRPQLEVDVAARIPGARIFTVDADQVVPGRWLPQETEAVEAFLGVPPATAPSFARSDSQAGDARLTSREREVLALLVAGRSNREIAGDLVLSERTVARHVANMYEKLGVHGRAEVTAYALRRRLV